MVDRFGGRSHVAPVGRNYHDGVHSISGSPKAAMVAASTRAPVLLAFNRVRVHNACLVHRWVCVKGQSRLCADQARL